MGLKNHHKTTSIVVYILAFVLFMPDASAQLFKPTFTASLLSPPQKVLGGINKIAIIDFENVSSDILKNAGADLGTKMADYLSAELLKEYRALNGKCFYEGGRTDIFYLVKREEITRVYQDRMLNINSLSDSQIIEIGKLVEADAVIYGSLSYSSTDERKDNSYRDKKGNFISSHSLIRTTSAEARMRVLDVASGEVLTQTDSRGSSKDKASGNKPPIISAVMKGEKIAEFACEGIAFQLAKHIAPYYYKNKFTFERVKNKEFKERASDINKYIKLGEIEKAYQMYSAIYEIDEFNPQLCYNMGAINEMTGNFREAKKLYSTAVNLAPENKVYTEALERAENNETFIETLQQLNIEITPLDLNQVLENTATDILAEKIKIKGPRSKRKNAYARPNESAKVLTQLPGSLELKGIEVIEDRDWIIAKLPDDSEGYFNKKDVITGK